MVCESSRWLEVAADAIYSPLVCGVSDFIRYLCVGFIYWKYYNSYKFLSPSDVSELT